MEEGLLGDYCDGSVFRYHPLFSIDPTALQIMLYYDDVEVVNPIGSRTKIHKLGELHIHVSIASCMYIVHVYLLCQMSPITALFYYLLGNISPSRRSSLKCIQLVTVVKSTDVSKYGIDKVLKPFMEDIQKLEHVS